MDMDAKVSNMEQRRREREKQGPDFLIKMEKSRSRFNSLASRDPDNSTEGDHFNLNMTVLGSNVSPLKGSSRPPVARRRPSLAKAGEESKEQPGKLIKLINDSSTSRQRLR